MYCRFEVGAWTQGKFLHKTDGSFEDSLGCKRYIIHMVAGYFCNGCILTMKVSRMKAAANQVFCKDSGNLCVSQVSSHLHRCVNK